MVKTKVCSGCNTELALSEFGINKTKADGRQTQCKKCRNKYAGKHYRKNKKYYYDKAKERQQQLHKQLVEYKKTLSCSRCGYSEHHSALDFHHISKKDIDICRAAQHGWSWERIMKEVSKCIVLCANCHRIEHNGVG